MTNGGSSRMISAACANRNVARALLIEHEAERVRARLDGGERVGRVGDAADFDFDAHGAGIAFHVTRKIQACGIRGVI